MKGVIFCSLVITRFVELIQQHLVFFEAIYTSFRRQNPFMASNQSPEGAKYTSDGHSPSLNRLKTSNQNKTNSTSFLKHSAYRCRLSQN
jgi:hypothetical protein